MQIDLSLFEQHNKGFVELAQIVQLPYQYNLRTLVMEKDKIKLYHYHSSAKVLHPIPVLVVFATVNRPEILDLFPENSFLRHLLDAGLDIYLLDWGYPDKLDSSINFNDYVQVYLKTSVDFICARAGIKAINLLGICQGGLISLCYSAIANNIEKLVLISAPIDFHTADNVASQLIRKINYQPKFGNVPGAWLTNFFISLRPFLLVGKKYLHFSKNLHDTKFKEKFLRVEKWLHDAPDQPANAFHFLLKNFYHGNKLIKNKIKLGNQLINLENINVPILNVMASNDDIVPMSATKVLKKFINKKLYHEKIFPSGHIGIYISEKVGCQMPSQIAKWLKAKLK